MAKHSFKVNLKVNHWFIKNLFKVDRGYSVEFFNWNSTGDECTAVFMCTSGINAPDISLNHTQEDLEEYVIKKFGGNIIKENVPVPNKVMNLKDNHIVATTVDTNPALKLLEPSERTSYKDYYDLVVSKNDLQEMNRTLHLFKNSHTCRILPFKVKQTSSFEADPIILRIGKWY
jgi:hypothetical protein